MTPETHRRIAIICLMAAAALIALMYLNGCAAVPESVVYELKLEAECDGVIEVTTEYFCDEYDIDMKAKTEEVAFQCQKDLAKLGCAERRCNVSLRRTGAECSVEKEEQ